MGRIRAKVVLTLAAVIATSLVVTVATFGQRPETLLPPGLQVTYDAQPVPIPVPSEGRIPVSLRLATSISREDGSHPPAAMQLRFAFDRQLRLDLGDVPVCPSGIRSQGRTGRDPCPEAKIASGRSKWEVLFPGQEPIRGEGRTSVYKIARDKIAIRAYIVAPVAGDIVITTKLSRAPAGSRYGILATASIPKVAGRNGSLVYMGLRFRKGLFSAACPQRKLQSSLATRFADGSLASVTSETVC
jgi:hypothetical protein